MGRESIEACPLCRSLCKTVECVHLVKHYRPLLDIGPTDEQARAEIVTMVREAKYCGTRLDRAMSMLIHVEEFLKVKGHKFMHLEVTRTLEQLRDRRRVDDGFAV